MENTRVVKLANVEEGNKDKKYSFEELINKNSNSENIEMFLEDCEENDKIKVTICGIHIKINNENDKKINENTKFFLYRRISNVGS